MRSSQSAGSLASKRAFNGAPDLDTPLAAEAWRAAIKNENAALGRLERNLILNQIRSREALANQYRHVAMPMPPTTMTLMMARLNRPENRELAVRRVISRTNTMPSQLFSNSTPWAQQLAITPYAPPLMKTPSRYGVRPGSAPWR